MAETYFTAKPGSAHEDRHFNFVYADKELHFETDAGVFSKQHVDPGSELLCRTLPDTLSGPVLDMGCGWGAMSVMIAAAHAGVQITMTDVNERALALAERNMRLNGFSAEAMLSDGFAEVKGMFSCIVMNPPIRAGKTVIFGMFEDAKSHLLPGGSLFLVIRKKQGAESALRFLQGIYETARVIEKSGGYWIIQCMNGEEQDNV